MGRARKFALFAGWDESFVTRRREREWKRNQRFSFVTPAQLRAQRERERVHSVGVVFCHRGLCVLLTMLDDRMLLFSCCYVLLEI